MIAAIVFYGSQPDYAVLFSELKPMDAQAIVEKLRTAQVPYRLSGGGTTISVPSEQVTELRLQVASSGMLSARHVGFDLFDKTNLGVTDFMQQVSYQRALEGELARTLEGMKEVENARVHITRARESVFTDKTEPAKASVMLALKAGDLSVARTNSIVSLVASAVEGLSPENVAVLDTNGKVLTKNNNEKETDAVEWMLNTRRKFEMDAADRVVALLEPLVGVGHVRADVTADFDFNKVEQTEEKYDPKSAVMRTQQTAEEFKNNATAPGGVAGTRANDPNNPAPALQPEATANGDGRSATATSYEIDKTTKRIVGNGARINKLSVSVLLDKGQTTAVASGNEAEDVKKIQELVVAAVGIDSARGDLISVQMLPFQKTPVAAPLPWYEQYRDLIKLGIKYGGLTLVALLLMLLVIRPAYRAIRIAAQPPPLPIMETPALLPPAPIGTEAETLSLSAGAMAMEREVNKELNKDAPTELTAGEENSLAIEGETKRVSNTEDSSATKANNAEQTKNTPTESEMERDKEPLTVAELAAEVAKQEVTEMAEQQIQAIQEASSFTKPLAIETKVKVSVTRESIIEYSKSEPEKVALLIRHWLREK
jgi:flagellar M-ring protein FliF